MPIDYRLVCGIPVTFQVISRYFPTVPRKRSPSTCSRPASLARPRSRRCACRPCACRTRVKLCHRTKPNPKPVFSEVGETMFPRCMYRIRPTVCLLLYTVQARLHANRNEASWPRPPSAIPTVSRFRYEQALVCLSNRDSRLEQRYTILLQNGG